MHASHCVGQRIDIGLAIVEHDHRIRLLEARVRFDYAVDSGQTSLYGDHTDIQRMPETDSVTVLISANAVVENSTIRGQAYGEQSTQWLHKKTKNYVGKSANLRVYNPIATINEGRRYVQILRRVDDTFDVFSRNGIAVVQHQDGAVEPHSELLRSMHRWKPLQDASRSSTTIRNGIKRSADIVNSIEGLYNAKRLHSALGYRR